MITENTKKTSGGGVQRGSLASSNYSYIVGHLFTY